MGLIMNIYNPYGLNNAYLPPFYGKAPVYGPGNQYGKVPAYCTENSYGKALPHSPENPYGAYGMNQFYNPYQNPYQYPCFCPDHAPDCISGNRYGNVLPVIKDYGPAPFVINIEEAALQNNTFRTALWTGKHLQVTLMSIGPGEDIGLEMHPELDQFIRIEDGNGMVMMGDRKDRLYFQRYVHDDYVIIVPAGKWHNLINTGHKPIKLYSIYAPPQHPHGTVHQTKADAEAAGHHHER